MIYAPNSAADRQLLNHSRALVRRAMALLRKSDHLVRAQRLRDELEEEQRKTGRRPDAAADPDQSRCAKASQAVTAIHRATAA
ncbi:hypothetical protein [Bradyrhizobium liaoningense]|uniref:hypothetical protein n=1 Tax=Bradyrhizobium liaoningense TaxID=43992 RepID=UPI001BAD7D0B|nr:hypothetical protein [Bradyrhizobium liaoningense]MBR0903612.1 hypothetical protein [Bradyrhizobium liaoningense]